MHDLLRDLKNLKQQKRVSTEALAEQSGISRATIARLWADDADPRLATMVEVARVLGASLILSTSASRQAFAENDVRPYRELLAEKERIIAAKDDMIRRMEHDAEALRKKSDASEKRMRIWLTVAVVAVAVLAALLIADLALVDIGFLRH